MASLNCDYPITTIWTLKPLCWIDAPITSEPWDPEQPSSSSYSPRAASSILLRALYHLLSFFTLLSLSLAQLFSLIASTLPLYGWMMESTTHCENAFFKKCPAPKEPALGLIIYRNIKPFWAYSWMFRSQLDTRKHLYRSTGHTDFVWSHTQCLSTNQINGWVQKATSQRSHICTAAVICINPS